MASIERPGIVARWRSLTPYLLSVLRIMAAAMFLSHGASKLLAFPGPAMPGGGPLPIGSLAGVAGLIEMVCGGLLLLGLLARPAAFIAAGEMAVAYFHMHAPHGFWPILNKGELAVLYCFVWLFISAAGAGPISLDWLLQRSPRHEVAGFRS